MGLIVGVRAGVGHSLEIIAYQERKTEMQGGREEDTFSPTLTKMSFDLGRRSNSQEYN